MSKIEPSFLTVYGHFSQPPRGNPVTGEIDDEPSAAPYHNWNERITASAYRPNAEAGNFQHMSFSFSQAILNWLKLKQPDVYASIVEVDRRAAGENNPAGNALATCYSHIILPLARKRDKITQIMWGIAAFEQHYGRKPLGFWLPEMAVDTETLTALAECGIQYTILAGKQVHDRPAGGGAGPYKVALPNGLSIAVFVRDDVLSSDLSFNIHTLGGAGIWSHQVLGPARKNVGQLLLLATEGETFGHHYAGEDQFLYWLLHHEAKQVGYQIITLDQYFLEHKPKHTIHIEERSSWGGHKGLTVWATGYVDKDQDTTWKGALRRALDNVASEVDRVYEDLAHLAGVDPWTLRNHYVKVTLGEISPEDFVSEEAPSLTAENQEKLKLLLMAQRLTQRTYNSYTFTDNKLDGPQPRYAIACAALALSLAQQATDRDLSDRLMPDLSVVTSPTSTINGLDILKEAMKAYQLDLHLA